MSDPQHKAGPGQGRVQQLWRTLDLVLSNTPDFAYIFDLEGRFTYINQALLTLWQKSLDEAVGKNFFELDYPTDLAARLQRQIQEVIDTFAPVRDETPFTGAERGVAALRIYLCACFWRGWSRPGSSRLDTGHY